MNWTDLLWTNRGELFHYCHGTNAEAYRVFYQKCCGCNQWVSHEDMKKLDFYLNLQRL